MADECVLLICLTPEEIEHIRQLLASFEIELASEDIFHFDGNRPEYQRKDICLIVIRACEPPRRTDQEIRQLKKMFPPNVPLLVLTPPNLKTNIKEYLHAGADDYWILPLDNTAFSVRFYVLLEYAQAAALSGRVEKTHDSSEISILRRILDKIQDSLLFFSPKASDRYGRRSSISQKWKKIRQLGSGGFGTVWLVRSHEKGIRAAAKIPHSPKSNLSSLRAAAILKRISLHPNAVHLIEVLEENGKIVLIQEYVEGSTLQELLEKGMKAEEKEKAFLQLLAAAAHAHQHKIMHRDIKPENIIITRSWELKLLDFGIAEDLSAESINSTVAGSRPFMAPEQILGKSALVSDVWALGVVLYLLSTKCLPFYNKDEKYLIDMILESDPVPPRELEPGIPGQMESIILKCLEKNIENRYADAGELRREILKYFPGFGKGKVLPE